MVMYTMSAMTVFGDKLFYGNNSKWTSHKPDRMLFRLMPSYSMQSEAQRRLPFPDAVIERHLWAGPFVISADINKVVILSEDVPDPAPAPIPSSKEQQALGWLLSMVECLGALNFTIVRRHNARPLYTLYGSRVNEGSAFPFGREGKKINFFVDPPSDGSRELIQAFQDLIHELTPPPSGGPPIQFLHKDFHFTAREIEVSKKPELPISKPIVATSSAYYISGMAGECPCYWTGNNWSPHILEARLFHPGLVDTHTLIQKQVPIHHRVHVSSMSIERLTYFMQYMHGNEPLPESYYQAKLLNELHGPKTDPVKLVAKYMLYVKSWDLQIQPRGSQTALFWHGGGWTPTLDLAKVYSSKRLMDDDSVLNDDKRFRHIHGIGVVMPEGHPTPRTIKQVRELNEKYIPKMPDESKIVKRRAFYAMCFADNANHVKSYYWMMGGWGYLAKNLAAVFESLDDIQTTVPDHPNQIGEISAMYFDFHSPEGTPFPTTLAHAQALENKYNPAPAEDASL